MPNEPININLNVKVEHEIYIKVDKALDNVFNEDSGLFLRRSMMTRYISTLLLALTLSLPAYALNLDRP